MKVKEVMTQNPVVVTVTDTVRDTAKILRQKHIGGLPVMEGDQVVGVVTESDILSLLTIEEPSEDLWLPSPLEIIEIPIREYINWGKTKKALVSIGNTKVREVMSSPVITINEEADIEEAAALMLQHRIARIPVMKGTHLVGIITRADIVQGIGRAYNAEKSTLGG